MISLVQDSENIDLGDTVAGLATVAIPNTKSHNLVGPGGKGEWGRCGGVGDRAMFQLSAG